jgi:hypothetical protein
MYCRRQNDADPQHSNIFFEERIWDLCEYRFHIWMKTKICHCPLVGYVLGKNEVISTENVAPYPPQAVFIFCQPYQLAVLRLSNTFSPISTSN